MPDVFDPAREWIVWEHATPHQLLRLLRILRVENKAIAAQIGTHAPLVSMWYAGKRAIPAHYRPRLLTWTQTALQQAMERNQKEVQALPNDDLKRAAMDTFMAPIREWRLQVFHAANTVTRAIHRNIGKLDAYMSQERLTARDCRNIATIAGVLLNQAQSLAALEEPDTVAEEIPQNEG